MFAAAPIDRQLERISFRYSGFFVNSHDNAHRRSRYSHVQLAPGSDLLLANCKTGINQTLEKSAEKYVLQLPFGFKGQNLESAPATHAIHNPAKIAFGMNQSKSEVESLIPHRGPMLLVDEIVERTDTSIVCRKTFSPDEYFFQGHYPDNPIVPGVILCEAAVQTGAVLVAGREGWSGTPVLTRLSDVRFKKIVKPGDTIAMEVSISEQVSKAVYMAARVRHSGKVAASLNFAVTVTE